MPNNGKRVARNRGFVQTPPSRKRVHTFPASESFKPAKIYSLKLAQKPPVARANGDADCRSIGFVVVALVAGGYPPARHQPGDFPCPNVSHF